MSTSPAATAALDPPEEPPADATASGFLGGQDARVTEAGGGEIVKIRLADDHPAGVKDALHHDGVLLRRVAERARAVRQRYAGHGDVVLDANPFPGERPVPRACDVADPDEGVDRILLG